MCASGGWGRPSRETSECAWGCQSEERPVNVCLGTLVSKETSEYVLCSIVVVGTSVSRETSECVLVVGGDVHLERPVSVRGDVSLIPKGGSCIVEHSHTGYTRSLQSTCKQ